MLSSSNYALSRQAPPVRPSRSLEGLERVIPPHTRSRLHLDKPLPGIPLKPLPHAPVMTGPTAWSDDSSTADSFEEEHERHRPQSTESYPVFVRSASDDLADFVDHRPSVSTLDRAPSVDPYEEKPTTSLTSITTFPPENRYYGHPPLPPHWTKSAGPNHYFREKKWDFFPELATPSALQLNSPHSLAQKPRRKDARRLNFSAFDFPRSSPRRTPSDKGSLTLAHDVRNSIRSYVQRRLSRSSLEREKSKRKQRPATAPSQRADPSAIHDYYWPDPASSTPVPQPLLDVDGKMAQLSVSTTTASSTSGESVRQAKAIPFQRKKQLAVPITPYQKYGAAIWDKSGKEKRVSYRQSQRVRFPKYRKAPTANNSVISSATPPLSSPSRTQLQQSTRDYVRALQNGTSHVLVAIDEARRKMIGSRVNRKQTELKSQIRLVGPVNPYTAYGADPWV